MTPTPNLAPTSKVSRETRIASLAGSTSRIFEASAGEPPLTDLPEVPRAHVRAELKSFQIVTGRSPVEGFWSLTFSADVFDPHLGRMVSKSLTFRDLDHLSEHQLGRLGREEIWNSPLPDSPVDITLQDRWQQEMASFANDLNELSLVMAQLSSGQCSLEEVAQRDFSNFVNSRCAELKAASEERSRHSPLLSMHSLPPL